ncbi:hypothetical protein GOV14_00510 [Candidatus Pacearchaeota archaeon]|nr:hypothetical protein [Candidatus Pacearchaeota archaeon]
MKKTGAKNKGVLNKFLNKKHILIKVLIISLLIIFAGLSVQSVVKEISKDTNFNYKGQLRSSGLSPSSGLPPSSGSCDYVGDECKGTCSDGEDCIVVDGDCACKVPCQVDTETKSRLNACKGYCPDIGEEGQKCDLSNIGDILNDIRGIIEPECSCGGLCDILKKLYEDDGIKIIDEKFKVCSTEGVASQDTCCYHEDVQDCVVQYYTDKTEVFCPRKCPDDPSHPTATEACDANGVRACCKPNQKCSLKLTFDLKWGPHCFDDTCSDNPLRTEDCTILQGPAQGLKMCCVPDTCWHSPNGLITQCFIKADECKTDNPLLDASINKRLDTSCYGKGQYATFYKCCENKMECGITAIGHPACSGKDLFDQTLDLIEIITWPGKILE